MVERLSGYVITAILFLVAKKLSFNLAPSFSFEFLFIYNIACSDLSQPTHRFSKIRDILSYLWFPPLLFSGPLERFGEFRRMHYDSSRVSILTILWYLSSAIINGLIAVILIKVFNPSLFDFANAKLPLLITYMIQASLVIVFQFISWIHLELYVI